MQPLITKQNSLCVADIPVKKGRLLSALTAVLQWSQGKANMEASGDALPILPAAALGRCKNFIVLDSVFISF